MAAQVEHNVHACPFGLCTRLWLSSEAGGGLLNVDLGARVCGDQVGQTSGERGMTLVDAAPTLAYDTVQLMGIGGAGANSLGSADVRTGG